MDSKHIFPNELWLEVIAQLPPDALRNLSSTHRALYDIARSLGFTEFTLRRKLDDALQCLDFWSSPNIAPTRASTHSDDGGSPHILMNAFFERLPRFTGLQRFYADLSFCAAAAGEDINPGSLTLEVATFITRYDYHMNDLWISVLSHDSLRELNFSNLLVLSKPGVLPFPNVQTLTGEQSPHQDIGHPRHPGQISCSPRLLERLYRSSTELNTSAGIIDIPGSRRIQPELATLTRITVEAASPCSKLLAELRGVTALPNISSLTVRFITSSENHFGQAQVDALFTLFPRLTELQLTLYPDVEEDGLFTPQPTTFLKMLAASTLLPSTLESLSLTWDFSFGDDSTNSAAGNDPAPPDAAEIPDFAGLREELIAKCEALTEIFLDGYYFLFWWRKVEWDGTAREVTAYTYDDSEHLRAQKTELKFGPPVRIS
ncbi:hypothetical protein B0H13DRAFT_1982841 [Mycena leptocephala]|nr:hypothetical protein B0H13DRAFT_1982841 [Mycena leptocephala]